MNNLELVRDVAVQAAKEAGEILLQHFQHLTPEQVHSKQVDGHPSPVTDWDLKANEIIKAHIKENFSDHDVLSEESPFEDNAGNWIWVIDPLDGTWNYINNKPFWGVSIGIFENNQPRVAVVGVPTEGDLYVAVDGQGSYKNNKRMTVSQEKDLARATVTIGKGHQFETRQFSLHAYDVLRPLTIESHTRGAAAVEMIRVASGEQTGTIMAGVKVWDVAGGAILVREAGGQVSDFSGSDWNLESTDILASNGKVHQQVLKAIKL